MYALCRIHTWRRTFGDSLSLNMFPTNLLIPTLQTTGIILWFLALIPSHPDVQKRAHEELDKVIGRETWPTAEDEKQLPYLRAIIKEVQRVHPAFLVPTPHISTEDFVYNGYYIPKGTGMVLNLHTIHRNENRYPNA